MASINPRKDRDGIIIGWQAQVRRRGYPAQSKTFDKKGQAQAWGRQVESEMERGVFVLRGESERTTLGECFERYTLEIMPTKKPGRGQTAELGFIRQWVSRPIAGKMIAAIRSADVASVIQDMEAEGKSPNTIRLHLASLSHLFSVARSNWGMESLINPVSIVRKPKVPSGRKRRVIPGEVGALLGATHDWRMQGIIALALETAAREGEIADMTWENVNIRQRSALLVDTKNGTDRTIPLSPAVMEILSLIPREIQGGAIFGVSAEYVSHAFGDICKKCGIENLHFHDLRHEAISRLFERTDLDIMEIRVITGHETLQMLIRYTHLRTARLADRLAGARRGSG